MRMSAHAVRGTGGAARGVGAGNKVMELIASCSVVAAWKEIWNPWTLDARARQRLEGSDEYVYPAFLHLYGY